MKIHNAISKVRGWVLKVWSLWWVQGIIVLLLMALMVVSPGAKARKPLEPLGVRGAVAIAFVPALIVGVMVLGTINNMILVGLEWRALRAIRRVWAEGGRPEPTWQDLTRTQHVLADRIGAALTLALGFGVWSGARWVNTSTWWREATAAHSQAERWWLIGVMVAAVLGGVLMLLERGMDALYDATFREQSSPPRPIGETRLPESPGNSAGSERAMDLERGFRRLVVVLSVAIFGLGIAADFLMPWPLFTGTLSSGALAALLWVGFYTVRWVARGFTSR